MQENPPPKACSLSPKGQERGTLVRQNTFRQSLCYSSQIPPGKNCDCIPIPTHSRKGHVGNLYFYSHLIIMRYPTFSCSLLPLPQARVVSEKNWVQILNFHPCQGLKIFYFCGVSGDPLGSLNIYSQGTLFLPCWDGVRGGLRKSQDFCQGSGIIVILLWWRLHGEKAWTPTLSSSNKEPLLPRGVKEAKWRTYAFHYYLAVRRLSPRLPIKSCDRRDLLKHEI